MGIKGKCIHLKTHEINLSRGNVGSTFGHRDARDIVGVTVQEVLLAIFDPLQDDGGAQWVDEVLSVWVNSQAGGNVSW